MGQREGSERHVNLSRELPDELRLINSSPLAGAIHLEIGFVRMRLLFLLCRARLERVKLITFLS